MSACNMIPLTIDWFGLRTDTYYMSDWTNGQHWIWDLGYRRRSEIVHAIIHNHSLDHLGLILGSGWDVNQTLRIPQHRQYEKFSFSLKHIVLQKEYKQRTALQEAARQGWTEGVKMLLDAGARCTTSPEQHNPLTLALQEDKCQPDLIELLLKGGADPNQHDPDTRENIALVIAVTHCKINANLSEIVKLLLEHGANPDVTQRVNIGTDRIPNWVERTVLYQAVQRRWADGVKILLDAGARGKLSAEVVNHLVWQVVQERRADLLKWLLEYGADPTVIYKVNIGTNRDTMWVRRTALHRAAELGWADGVKMLLEAGAKLKTSDNLENLLVLLVLQEHRLDILRWLLDHGADPTVEHKVNNGTTREAKWVYRTLLDEAVEQGWTEGMKIFCDSGAFDDCLIAAVQKHDFDRLKSLLQYRANYISTGGQKIGHEIATCVSSTALHEAAKRGWTEAVRLLLNAGAKCKTPDALENPLTLALQSYMSLVYNHSSPPALIHLLLIHGADPNDHDGQFDNVPLLQAITNWRLGQNITANVQLLLQYGADPTVAAEWRSTGMYRTALECAIRNPCVGDNADSNTVRSLIRHGADMSHINIMLLKHHFIQRSCQPQTHQTPLILLQAGMRVSHAAQAQLSNMAAGISTRLLTDSLVYDMWVQLEEIEETVARTCMYVTQRQETRLPEYWTQQVVDLKEFSDKSLHIYPEDKWQDTLDQIRAMLEFLSQPQLLQWYCRRCLRENLVSLLPSMIKPLPIPARLKRYILCHEI